MYEVCGSRMCCLKSPSCCYPFVLSFPLFAMSLILSFCHHVVKLHCNKLQRKSDDYNLLFDDDEEDGNLPERAVPFYRVVALPEGHRQ
ncbi:unnamed protein product [Triticum turgidum subsp. durum]|uniref:SGF29 C-terminal domain-containing protein n=1 Tax=Triticum turgidum subsp. durum TaxID=4567 RepID=A0A9R0X346_TRITD|nr:unnamed protein product [Triticum turgidum subsp. durum]